MNFGTREHAEQATQGRHPGVQSALQWLTFSHLPEALQKFSEPFYEAAVALIVRIETDSAELTTALNKLIEAKDSAVRAGIRHNTGRAGSVPRPQTVVDPPILVDNRIGPNFGKAKVPARPDQLLPHTDGAQVPDPRPQHEYQVTTEHGRTTRIEVLSSKIEVSDGYHTFDELYDHRRALTAALCKALGLDAWRSKAHHPEDSPMFGGGYFIVGINLPTGTVTYHYKLHHWDDFAGVVELENAPKWDGAAPDATVDRLLAWVRQ